MARACQARSHGGAAPRRRHGSGHTRAGGQAPAASSPRIPSARVGRCAPRSSAPTNRGRCARRASAGSRRHTGPLRASSRTRPGSVADRLDLVAAVSRKYRPQQPAMLLEQLEGDAPAGVLRASRTDVVAELHELVNGGEPRQPGADDNHLSWCRRRRRGSAPHAHRVIRQADGATVAQALRPRKSRRPDGAQDHPVLISCAPRGAKRQLPRGFLPYEAPSRRLPTRPCIVDTPQRSFSRST